MSAYPELNLGPSNNSQDNIHSGGKSTTLASLARAFNTPKLKVTASPLLRQ